MADYYQVLGLSHDADQQEIRQAFRRKARKYHPDLNKKAGASAKFMQVNEAYQTLSDPKKRIAYNLDWLKAYRTRESNRASREEQARETPRQDNIQDDAVYEQYEEESERSDNPFVTVWRHIFTVSRLMLVLAFCSIMFMIGVISTLPSALSQGQFATASRDMCLMGMSLSATLILLGLSYLTS